MIDTDIYLRMADSKIAEESDLTPQADAIGAAILDSLPRWRDRWKSGEKSGRRWQYTWAVVNAGVPFRPVGCGAPTVLDAGADDVSLQYYYARMNYSVTSLDCNNGALARAIAEAKAQGLSGKMIFLKHDLLKPLTFAYDLVLCLSVLEHIPDWQTAARQLVRATKPGGRLVLTVDVDMPGATTGYFTPDKLVELAKALERFGMELVGKVEKLAKYPERPLVNMLGQKQDQPLTWAGLLCRRVA